METINDHRLLDAYVKKRGLRALFSGEMPRFFLLHYAPGELLTNSFSPSKYFQFIVEGGLLLYDMPDEDSVIYIKVSNGAAPTGKPVPTVTEAVTPGPVTVNVTPSPKAAANKKAKQNDSFPIILFLIPIITAALCIGAITFAVISKKKDKNKNNG